MNEELDDTKHILITIPRATTGVLIIKAKNANQNILHPRRIRYTGDMS
jgi:hypothetical protein